MRTDLLSAALRRESTYGERAFQPIVMRKLQAIQQLLREGRIVFFLDTARRATPPPAPSEGGRGWLRLAALGAPSGLVLRLGPRRPCA